MQSQIPSANQHPLQPHNIAHDSLRASATAAVTSFVDPEAANSYALVHINQLSKSFHIKEGIFARRDVEIIRSLSLQVNAPSCVGIVGANGSGKSTLLRLLCGIYHADSGSVSLNGHDSRKHPRHYSKQLAYAFDSERSLYWKLSGWENLKFFAAIQGHKLPNDEAMHLSDQFGLATKLKERLETYSAGQRQKLNLMRAFLVPASVYILDEPTNHLDADGLQSLEALATEKVAAGSTIIHSAVKDEQQLLRTDARFYLRNGSLSPTTTQRGKV